MGETFEIFGTLIRYDAIKDFRIIQKEYIYRPTYRECPKSILGALGIANMWEAVFADVGVSIIAILNSMRLLKVK